MQVQTQIHPSAVIEPGAQLGVGVEIGPFCSVGADVVLGDGVKLISHVSIAGATTLGADCTVFPTATLGQLPQNRAHKGGRTALTIGRNCTIREGVTMHLGTDTSRGATTVGDNGNFLAFCHVGHDCDVGNNVTFANGVLLGGHCEIGDFVILGGLVALHQFTRIGHHAFIGGMTGVYGDVIPYGMAIGNRASLRGLNVVGMKRSGLPRSEILALRKAYKMIFDRERPVSENLVTVREAFADSATVGEVVAFLTDREKRPFIVPRLGRAAADDDDDES